MLYSVGTKVRLIHTGDEGRVIAMLSNGMLKVHVLDDDMVIPVSTEDLELLDDTITTKIPSKSTAPSPKIAPTPTSKPKNVINFPPNALTHEGIFLAFNPKLNADATVEKYNIQLINDTDYDLLFQYSLSLNGSVEEKINKKLDAASVLSLGELWYDELNDAPEVHLASWRITTDGTGSKQEKKLRLKAKTFFKEGQVAPLLNKQLPLFQVFGNLKGTREKPKENLQSYTKRLSKPKTRVSYTGKLYHIDSAAYAEFPTEIDLHIEKLVTATKKLNKGAILKIQLAAFDEYINRAIRLGIDRIFVIHGVGEGKLRNAIATRLINLPEVQSFKNEFHPRYGFGATEVIL